MIEDSMIILKSFDDHTVMIKDPLSKPHLKQAAVIIITAETGIDQRLVAYVIGGLYDFA